MSWRNSSSAVLALLALTCWISPDPAGAARGPSTAEERAKALELVELLETSPGSRAARDARAWLLSWLPELPDLRVTYCLNPLGTAQELDGVPPELTVQPFLSQAAYMIRHPEAESTSPETFLAGVEGALRSYEAMRKAKDVDELPVFETLRGQKQRGELAELVKARARKCA